MPRLVLNFSTPVNPTISTEPGHLRMSFQRDPVVATSVAGVEVRGPRHQWRDVWSKIMARGADGKWSDGVDGEFLCRRENNYGDEPGDCSPGKRYIGNNRADSKSSTQPWRRLRQQRAWPPRLPVDF